MHVHIGHAPVCEEVNVYPCVQDFMQCTASGHTRITAMKSGFFVVVVGGVRAEKNN